MKSYTYADIQRGLLKETYLYFKFIAYIFAVPFAFIAYKLKISPNQLTTLGILLVIPAMYFNLQGKYIIAILIFHIFFLIDAADGVLARGTDAKSKLGAYLDIIAHYIFHTLFFITFAIKVYQDGYILLALFMSSFLIVNSLYRVHCDFILKASIKDSDEAGLLGQSSDKERKSFLKKMMSVIVEAFNFPNVLVYLTLLIWNFYLLKIYFLCATFVSILYFIYTIYQSFIRMRAP
jgi:phosphatidylglycerophosphate synthase